MEKLIYGAKSTLIYEKKVARMNTCPARHGKVHLWCKLHVAIREEDCWLLRLASLWQEFQQASIAVKRLGDIMDAPAEPHVLSPGRTAEGKGEVRIENLSFRYSPDHPYLMNRILVLQSSHQLIHLPMAQGLPPHPTEPLLSSRQIRWIPAGY